MCPREAPQDHGVSSGTHRQVMSVLRLADRPTHPATRPRLRDRWPPSPPHHGRSQSASRTDDPLRVGCHWLLGIRGSIRPSRRQGNAPQHASGPELTDRTMVAGCVRMSRPTGTFQRVTGRVPQGCQILPGVPLSRRDTQRKRGDDATVGSSGNGRSGEWRDSEAGRR